MFPNPHWLVLSHSWWMLASPAKLLKSTGFWALCPRDSDLISLVWDQVWIFSKTSPKTMNVQPVLKTTETAWKRVHGEWVEEETQSIFPPYSHFHSLYWLALSHQGPGDPNEVNSRTCGKHWQRLLSSDLHVLAFWSCSVLTFLSACFCDFLPHQFVLVLFA